MAPRLPYVTSSLSQPANHASSHGRRARAVRSLFFGKERAPSGGVLGVRAVPLFTENPRRVLLGNRASGIRGSRKSSLVLCSASGYTALTGLHRTNSPATRLQQPVAPRNKSSQQVWLYPGRRQQDYGVTLL